MLLRSPNNHTLHLTLAPRLIRALANARGGRGTNHKPQHTPPVSIKSAVTMNTIILNKNEIDLFSMLRRVVSDRSLGTTVRVAGGWVRDKILYGKAKDDIDICLDNMTGEQFCLHLNAWARDHGQSTFKFGVIQSNPDKSKHLETATLKINNLEVDFVNLRSETYVEHSRIPIVEFGSPLEDARRRDLTVNSLFYNIQTDEVEDFTGSGLEDMKNRVLRTPLDPHTTLLDDPLRAFRVIRFACRLNFAIEPALLDACRSAEVITAITAKVSRERILTEVQGILEGNHAQSARAMFLLNELGLLPCILFPSRADDTFAGVTVVSPTAGPSDNGTALEPAVFDLSRKRGATYMILAEFVGKLTCGESGGGIDMIGLYPAICSICKTIDAPRESLPSDRLCRRFAALTQPFSSISVIHPKKKNKTLLMSDHILQNEIRVSAKVASTVDSMHEGISELKQILFQHWGVGVTNISGKSSGMGLPDRAQLGSFVKNCGSLYMDVIFLTLAELVLDEMISQVVVAMVIERTVLEGVIRSLAYHMGVLEVLPGGYFANPPSASPASLLTGTSDVAVLSADGPMGRGEADLVDLVTSILLGSEKCVQIFRSVEELICLINSMELHEIWLQPAIMTGKEIQQLLPNIPRGPVFSELVAAEFRWRLLNPSGSVADLSGYLSTKYPQYK